MDPRWVERDEMTFVGDVCQITEYGVFGADGFRINSDLAGLEEGTPWRLPTIGPDDIYPGLHALVVTDDGGDRGESDYFKQIVFSSNVAPGALYVYLRQGGEIYLPDYGITPDLEGRIRRDVLVIEETLENIRLLHEELKRTNYFNAAKQLVGLYRKCFR